MSRVIETNVLCNVKHKDGFDKNHKKKTTLRPFPILPDEKGKLVQSIGACFPGEYKNKIKSGMFKKDLVVIRNGVAPPYKTDVESKPIFLSNPSNQFFFGLYEGDIIDIGKATYNLFSIKKDFEKQILFPSMSEIMAKTSLIFTFSSIYNGRIYNSYLKYPWKQTIEENIKFMSDEIESLKGCFENLSIFPSEEEIEIHARSRELYLKLSKIGGKNKKH